VDPRLRGDDVEGKGNWSPTCAGKTLRGDVTGWGAMVEELDPRLRGEDVEGNERDLRLRGEDVEGKERNPRLREKRR
jgi:hypothetical protein